VRYPGPPAASSIGAEHNQRKQKQPGEESTTKKCVCVREKRGTKDEPIRWTRTETEERKVKGRQKQRARRACVDEDEHQRNYGQEQRRRQDYLRGNGREKTRKWRANAAVSLCERRIRRGAQNWRAEGSKDGYEP